MAAAIAAANPGDEIWIAAGAYPENITLKGRVPLYGGFAGTETERGQRDWGSNVTSLVGAGGWSIVTVASDSRNDFRLDGLEITGGTETAVHVYAGCDLLVANYTIRDNVTSGNQYRHGAGLFASSSRVTLCHCEFRNNHTSALPDRGGYGGALFASGGAVYANDVSFVCNTSPLGAGGAIYADEVNPVYLFGCSFVGNRAMDHGGAVAVVYSDLRFANCVFHDNHVGVFPTSTGYGGGAVSLNGAAESHILGCTFSGNSCNWTKGGGAVHLQSGSVTHFLNCAFHNNVNAVGDGGNSIGVEIAASADISHCVAHNTSGDNDVTDHFAGTLGQQVLIDYATMSFDDPLFVRPVDGQDPADFHLLPGSPCIDAGLNPQEAAAQFGWSDFLSWLVLDRDGFLRPFDWPGVTNLGPASFADIGAYEHH